MSSAGKPYSNIQMAAVNKMMFDRGVNNAKLRMNVGHTRAHLSVKLRRI
jgi:DNA-binding Xre family transcriptional regulator